MSALAKKEEIVMISPTYGRITNPETLAAFEETEEILRQIKTGERVPMYNSATEMLDELLAEIDAELKEEVDG